jgi:hypothetical protein
MTMTAKALKWMHETALLRPVAAWLGHRPDAACATPELSQARALIAAVDAGGVPLNPAKVNQIGRALGLEVSSKAPVEDTIERIRRALARA